MSRIVAFNLKLSNLERSTRDEAAVLDPNANVGHALEHK